VIALFALLSAQVPFRHAATPEFQQRKIAGFTVMISPSAAADPAAIRPVLKRLSENLKEIGEQLPGKAFKELKVVKIWIEHDNPQTPGMVFHPSADWLRQNGYNVDKAGNVEIGNLAHFISWQEQQPSMVLHELSHAWEFRFADEASKKELEAAFAAAQASGKYEQVDHYDHVKRRAYAMNNSHEYFAEICEAYFGKNDFYPFVRSDLLEFDPQGYRLVEHAWGIAKR